GFSPSLSWSHYRTLSKVEHKNERLFYEIEAEKEGWSVPVLERERRSIEERQQTEDEGNQDGD
ncbi:MAG: DUF1016 N-terminal domain-containing protein, partial [Patescibacteria group bacterium]|nr:DUF1016 N-terminal domain-containing protein [Patescibacteria group bacterium]